MRPLPVVTNDAEEGHVKLTCAKVMVPPTFNERRARRHDEVRHLACHDPEYSLPIQRSHSRNRKEEIQASIKRVRDGAALCSGARVHGLNERSTVHGNG